jgi:hypothetical protein
LPKRVGVMKIPNKTREHRRSVKERKVHSLLIKATIDCLHILLFIDLCDPYSFKRDLHAKISLHSWQSSPYNIFIFIVREIPNRKCFPFVRDMTVEARLLLLFRCL